MTPTEWFLACSVCFGNPDSLLGKGAKAGVLFLLGVVLVVLGGIAVTGVVWARRARTAYDSSYHEDRESSSS